MPAARLTQIRIRNFKSIGPKEQTVDLKPLTVLIGRNNSGKSTVIQSLLLLKQTLEDPRPEVQLALQGNYLRATSLRELTHGWPEDMTDSGPEITLRWDSEVDARKLFFRMTNARRMFEESRQKKTFEGTPIEWISNLRRLADLPGQGKFATEMSICFRELKPAVLAQEIRLKTLWSDPGVDQVSMRASWENGVRELTWDYEEDSVRLGEFHFIPYIPPPSRFDSPDPMSAYAFEFFYEKQLDALKPLLASFAYVSSSREEVPPYYAMPTSVPARSVLVNGGNAPELLYGRQADVVHFATMNDVNSTDGPMVLPDRVTSRPLKEAANDVLHSLGIDRDVSFSDVQELGLFRVLFGRAPLNQVGRGIGQVLPVIVAGLLTDPLLGETLFSDASLSDYVARCEYFPILALEELESHLHPKAQTRLAHFLVALARSGRQLIVETHSDHLVRRLRGLVARTEKGSESEKWLLENVNIVEVEQTAEGVTYLHQADLTSEGSIEKWPADFMDEGADEERAIYFAAMEKSPPAPPPADESFFMDAPVNGKG